jgi:hypothetical protein
MGISVFRTTRSVSFSVALAMASAVCAGLGGCRHARESEAMRYAQLRQNPAWACGLAELPGYLRVDSHWRLSACTAQQVVRWPTMSLRDVFMQLRRPVDWDRLREVQIVWPDKTAGGDFRDQVISVDSLRGQDLSAIDVANAASIFLNYGVSGDAIRADPALYVCGSDFAGIHVSHRGSALAQMSAWSADLRAVVATSDGVIVVRDRSRDGRCKLELAVPADVLAGGIADADTVAFAVVIARDTLAASDSFYTCGEVEHPREIAISRPSRWAAWAGRELASAAFLNPYQVSRVDGGIVVDYTTKAVSAGTALVWRPRTAHCTSYETMPAMTRPVPASSGAKL